MREEGGRERERGRKEGKNSSRRRPFSVHSLDPVLCKCEVPGPSDVVCREVADNRVATQQLAEEGIKWSTMAVLVSYHKVITSPLCG